MISRKNVQGMSETAAASVTLEVRPPDHLLQLIMAVIVTLEVRPVTKMAKSVTNKIRHAKQDLTVNVVNEPRGSSCQREVDPKNATGLSSNDVISVDKEVSILDQLGGDPFAKKSFSKPVCRTTVVKKNLLASLAHSHRAQLASLARMSAPGARDLMVVALRAPTYINFALRAQCCVLHSA